MKQGIEEDVDDKRVNYHKGLSTKSLTDKIEYKKTQTKVRKKGTEEENNYWEQTCERIQNYIGGRRCSEAWRTLKNLRKKVTEEKSKYWEQKCQRIQSLLE